MAYSPPSNNITSSFDFFNWINVSVGSWFFPGLIIATYFVILIRMMYNSPTSQAFASASFICMILSVLLRVTGLVSNSFMIIFIILTAIGAVWMHQENAKFS